MGLIKCPDCEKMVSERVAACPFCGCPSKFFEDFSKNKSPIDTFSDSISDEQDETVEKAVLQEKEVQENSILLPGLKDITFKFKNVAITYSGGSEKYAEIAGNFFCHADNLYYKYLEGYRKSNLTQILGSLKRDAENDINSTIEAVVKYLYSQNIRMTANEFRDKYNRRYDIDLDPKLIPIKEAVSDVQDESVYRQQQRNLEKASRGRWQGGGFGVSGAVKGAMTAGLMNMGSDFVHSFGDASRANRDQNVINGKLNGIENSSKYEKIYANAVRSSILGVMHALDEELIDHNLVNEITYNYKKAESIFTATINYEKDADKLFAGIVESIGLYPFSTKFYDPVFEQLHDSDCEFFEFISFWHIESFFNGMESEYQKKKEDEKRRSTERENFESKFGLVGFNYEDKSASNYKLIRSKIHKQAKADFRLELPDDVAEYLDSCSKEKQFPYYEYQDWMPAESDLFDCFFALKLDGCFFRKSLINIFWLYGSHTKEFSGEDDTVRLTEEQKKQIEMDGGELLLYKDTSLMSNGKNGIALTRKNLYDLKTKEEIPANAIRRITFYKSLMDKYILSFEGQSNKINLPISASSEKYDISDRGINYLICVLSILLVRYAGNNYLWNDKMVVERPCASNAISTSSRTVLNNDIDEEKKECPQCGKMISKNTKFCNYCGSSIINDTPMESEKNESILCDSCGKSIRKGVKFCNYCGRPVANDVQLQPPEEKSIRCSSCGLIIKPDAKFCNYCGTPVDG